MASRVWEMPSKLDSARQAERKYRSFTAMSRIVVWMLTTTRPIVAPLYKVSNILKSHYSRYMYASLPISIDVNELVREVYKYHNF